MALDTAKLRVEIQKVYSDVVSGPKKGYHFHTGPEYAADLLGYSGSELAELPDSVTAPFAGVGKDCHPATAPALARRPAAGQNRADSRLCYFPFPGPRPTPAQ